MLKKKIIFFLPNYSYGGAGKSILNICKNLNKKKYEIYVISLNKNYYKKDLTKFCKEIIEIKSSSTILSLSKIKKYLEKFNKDNSILISNINYANALFVIYFKILNNFKLILIERTPLQELFIYFSFRDFVKKFIIKIIAKYFYKKADHIITNSKKTAIDYSNFSKMKCSFIYPLTIHKMFNTQKKKLNKNGLTNILTISRLSREKNLIEQLKAFKILKLNKIFLIILGDGSQKTEISEYIKKYNINSKVIKYSDEKKIKLLKNCKIYICSSFFEGFPNAVVEAINYNMPVISSKNHGGIEEIILNGKGGELYESGNEFQLSEKINKILKNYNRHVKKTLLAKKALNRFTKNNIKKYEDIFDNILE